MKGWQRPPLALPSASFLRLSPAPLLSSLSPLFLPLSRHLASHPLPTLLPSPACPPLSGLRPRAALPAPNVRTLSQWHPPSGVKAQMKLFARAAPSCGRRKAKRQDCDSREKIFGRRWGPAARWKVGKNVGQVAEVPGQTQRPWASSRGSGAPPPHHPSRPCVCSPGPGGDGDIFSAFPHDLKASVENSRAVILHWGGGDDNPESQECRANIMI